MSSFEFSTVSGYFLQDDFDTDAKGFDFVSYRLRIEMQCVDFLQTKVNFGLKSRLYASDPDDSELSLSQWQRFSVEMNRLNRESDSKTRYKLLYLGRHGQGMPAPAKFCIFASMLDVISNIMNSLSCCT